MSVDEIRKLANNESFISFIGKGEDLIGVTKNVKGALLAYAAMVERCEERRYENMDLIDYILKGATNEHLG